MCRVVDLNIIARSDQDDQTVADPHATTELHGYDHPGNPIPRGSSILPTGSFNAKTVSVVVNRTLG